MVVELFVKNEMPVTVVCLANNKYGNIYISKVLYSDVSCLQYSKYPGGLYRRIKTGCYRTFRACGSYMNNIFRCSFTTKPTGRGMGLSLSYDMVKAHNGELKVETTEGESTTFIITLPV